MHITVAAVGTRLEPWIYEVFEAYRARLPRQFRLQLEEVPLARRSPTVPPADAIEAEGRQLLRRVPDAALLLALDEHGEQWSSMELAEQLRRWLDRHPQVVILIGGPDGLSAACRERADRLWSLSRLTLPHGLVRVLLVEQLYRAWSILQGHPYHRV